MKNIYEWVTFEGRHPIDWKLRYITQVHNKWRIDYYTDWQTQEQIIGDKQEAKQEIDKIGIDKLYDIEQEVREQKTLVLKLNEIIEVVNHLLTKQRDD